MRIVNISTTFQDYPDDESQAVIVYFAGCSHGCLGCQNREEQEYNCKGSYNITPEDLDMTIETLCQRNRTNKVVFSGGDPFFEKNRQEVLELASYLENKHINVCIYTGFPITEVKNFYEGKLLTHASFFKCGKYRELQKETSWGKTNESLVLATRNQAFYNSNFEKISADNILYFSRMN